MFLHPNFVASTNRYVAAGPEDRAPVFKHGPNLPTVGGSFLRYSTTSPAPEKPKAPSQAAKAMARIAAASN